MPPRPPFFPQETDYSCAVACLRMVLAFYGIERTEEELRAACDCSWEGVQAFRLVEAARQFGLAGTRKYNLSFGELLAQLAAGKYPIVFVRTYLENSLLPTQHTFVVFAANHTSLAVLDPWQGERELAAAQFEREWRQMRGLTILCEK